MTLSVVSKELSQWNAEKSQISPLAIVIRGKFDATDAFGSATDALFLQIAKTHQIAISVIDDAAFFGEKIRTACLNFDKKASLLVIVSHGYPDRLKLGEKSSWHSFNWTKKPFYTKEDIREEDFCSLLPDAKIFLLSCSSGQSLAQSISDVSKRIVFAPMGFIYDTGTCFENWPNPEIRVLSYDETNQQQIGVFTPSEECPSISSLSSFSFETKASFSAMADYLKKRAEEGDGEAQLKLGSFYLDGRGTCEKSEEMAAHWISLAAAKQVPRAQYVLGLFYLSGQGGVEQSVNKAIEFFEQSARQGFPLALFQIGTYFYTGQYGFVQSDEEAYTMFCLAAKKGVPQANYYLGLMHEWGHGVWHSLNLAKKYYEIAEEFGVPEAKLRLANLLFQEEQHLLDGSYCVQRVSLFAIALLQRIRESIFWSCFILRRRLKTFKRALIGDPLYMGMINKERIWI